MADIGTDIGKAASILRSGGLVGIPTETVYGLAGDATDDQAVSRIFLVKARPVFDPLIVHVAGIDALDRFALEIPPRLADLMEQHWPGPLTVLLPRRKNIPDLVTSGLDRAGFRCPAHPLTQELLRGIDFPLAAPSANPFGYVSPTTANHVDRQLGERIPYILDGGACRVGLESTIVGWEEDGVVIHRLGGLPVEEIERITGRVRIHSHSSSNPTAPGQLQSHYAPLKKVLFGPLRDLAEQAKRSGTRFALLGFQSDHGIEGSACTRILSPAGTTEEAARNLFGHLRDLDESEADIILTEPVPQTGLGPAINDRLRRASA